MTAGKHAAGTKGAMTWTHVWNCGSKFSSSSSIHALGYARSRGRHTASISCITATSRSANAACMTRGRIVSLCRSTHAASIRQRSARRLHARCRVTGDDAPCACSSSSRSASRESSADQSCADSKNASNSGISSSAAVSSSPCSTARAPATSRPLTSSAFSSTCASSRFFACSSVPSADAGVIWSDGVI